LPSIVSDAREVRAAAPNTVPAWHPAALIALMLLVAATGSVLSARHAELPPPHRSLVLGAYVPLLLVNWGLVLYACRVGRPRSAFTELAGTAGYTLRRACVDVALACCVAAVLLGGEAAWQLAFGAGRNAAAEALLPVTAPERAAWCLVAVSVGVSEELVYRGYLVDELTRASGSRVAAVLGQALLFGLAHADQGSSAVLRFFCYAVGLAVLALTRRSLVPGMIAHVAVDLLAGLSH
jgi:membrane protease YdiL (CAAX protease family)